MLDYEGLTLIEKENVCKFITISELEKSKAPSEIINSTEAYLKGKSNNDSKKIPKQQTSYLHQKVKKKIFGPSTKDASLLNKLRLELLQNFPNSCIETEVNEQSQLTSFLFASDVMKNLYIKYNDVILVDSTYKTNKYKMPLLIFAGINNFNKTFLVGFAVIKDETYASVSWVFSKLFDYFGFKPKIIVSDSCSTLRKTISEEMNDTTHLICGWHVAQNIKSHLSPLRKSYFL